MNPKYLSLNPVLRSPLRVKKSFMLQLLSTAPRNFTAGAQALTPTEQWHPQKQLDAPLPALTCRTKAGQT